MTVAENTTPTMKTMPKKSAGLPFDMPLVVAVGALLIFGLMMVYSSTFDYSYQLYGSPATIFLKQMQWVGVGLLSMFLFARLDYHLLRRLALPMLGGAILALLWVLVFGSAVFNAQRSFFNGSIQPSELAKLTIILYLAVWLASKGDKIQAMSYGIVPFGMIVGLVCTFILLQPDLHAALTVLIIAALMFFVAGADVFQMGAVTVLGVGTVVILLQLPIRVAVTGRQRLADYLSGLQDLTQASWHIKQAAIAFVNGGVFGRGLGESHQKFGFLPAAHTDSIFAIVGEELGLLGCALVIALFVIVVWRGFKIAAQARDPLGALLAAGISIWLAFEAVVNISAIVGLMPFAGNALPFLSYGGSNIVVTLTAMGVLVSISRRTEAEPLARRVRLNGNWQTAARVDGNANAAFDLSRRDRRGRLSRFGRR